MSKIRSAVDWALCIASDGKHGYDQTSRWGPDYDCSSLVISAWEHAGVPVKTRGATYTGNMKNTFLSCGFQDVTAQVNRSTGDGLKTGDVLLHEKNHTALYIGSGQIVHASGNERGGITGGRTGDQTGGEICTRTYYNYPWDCVLRYTEEPASETGSYIVQTGDTLWGLAEKWLGAGYRYREIMERNHLSSDVLSVGQLLYNPAYTEAVEQPVEPQEDDKETCNVRLPVLSYGLKSEAVRSMQMLLWAAGYSLQNYGFDGEWGEETETAFRAFQAEKGMTGDVCDAAVWAALIG